MFPDVWFLASESANFHDPAREEELRVRQEQDVLLLVDVVELLLQAQIPVVEVRRHFSHHRRRADAIFIQKRRAAQEAWKSTKVSRNFCNCSRRGSCYLWTPRRRTAPSGLPGSARGFGSRST